MLNYYVKIAFRNFKKYKSYFLISVAGLAIGLAVCMMLLLYVQNELSYDRYNENADNIYRLCQSDEVYHSPQTAKILADGIPEIEDYGRLLVTWGKILEYGEHKLKETGIIYADPEIFRIFSFNFISGDPLTALNDPYTMVISELIAKKYFGTENPIGKVLKIDNEAEYTITGVIENMPENSHFRYDIFMTLTGENELFGSSATNWGWQNFLIYFVMHDGFSEDEVIHKAVDLIVKAANLGPDDGKPVYSLQQLKDIHLHSAHISNDIQPQNSLTYVLIFAGIAILILFIACFNYINLFTANATSRSSEIGIKKVVGATRRQLLTQFMGESFILLLISFFLSLIIMEISLPVMSGLLGKQLEISDLLNIGSILGILGIFLITGILAGAYPAIFLSSIQPVKVLKGSSFGVASKSNFKKILVIAQFIIVVALISSAMLMLLQISYMKKKELGFNKENIIASEFEDFSDIEKFKTLKQNLLEQNFVLDVSAGSRIPTDELNNYGRLLPAGETKPIGMRFVHVSFDYFETLGISAESGRTFSDNFQTDIDNAVVLNESAVKLLKFEGDAIGQPVYCNWPKSDREIIGVIKDFHFESLYKKIPPTAFVLYYGQCRMLMLKVQSSDIQNTINMVNDICSEYYPDLMFEFHTMDEKLDNIYKEDKRTMNLMIYFASLAILIACIGLFGLASFMLKRRTKEIGIYKIFGSGLGQLMVKLSKDFAVWVLIACVIAWPLSWLMMRRWLEGFAYSVNINIWVFLISGIITLVLALVTVSWLSWRTARTNPVDSLRYE
ncbi:MAG: ABC transporter permease [Deltaproteobacteria bacterium]|nr:ABC transporter permease [Deltaproteobacteria bacterium]